jgi:ATP-dependent protease ClpP protease subunit
MGDEIADAKDIRLILNSDGGDSVFALMFFDTYVGRVTEARIVGRCYSAALTIALTGKTVLMRRDATIMIHPPHTFSYSAAPELERQASRLANTTKRIFDIIKQKTELDDSIINGWLSGNADFYLTAEQAKGFGLVDEIFDAPEAAPAPPSTVASRKKTEPERTEQEQFLIAVLHAMGVIKIRNRNKFLRDLVSFARHSTIIEKSN